MIKAGKLMSKYKYLLWDIDDTAIAQKKKLERSGLDKIANNIFISELVGFEKPNIHFFEKVIAEAGIEDVTQELIPVGTTQKVR